MVAAVISRTRNSVVARTSSPVLIRECERSPGLFDLPEPAEVELAASPLAGTDAGFITLEDVDAERSATVRFARAARAAVAACARCPFLQQCQRETSEQIFSGQRPQTEVRGAVAFDAEGLPAASVHQVPARRDLEQLTLDVELELSGVRHAPTTDWVPEDLKPVSTHDPYAVDLAMDERRNDVVVTQSHLDSRGKASEGRIVLSYSDELALIREGLTDGHSKNRLKIVLDTKWEKIAEIAHILGCAPEGKFVPSQWAERRRALAQSDTDAAAAMSAAASREQYARDLVAIRNNVDHESTLDLAERSQTRIFGGPTPLSSRLRRTTWVSERTASMSRFSGVSL